MAVAVQVGHVREAQADVSVHAHAARAAHVLDVVDALVSGCHNPLEDLDLHGIACMHHGVCVGVGVCVGGVHQNQKPKHKRKSSNKNKMETKDPNTGTRTSPLTSRRCSSRSRRDRSARLTRFTA